MLNVTNIPQGYIFLHNGSCVFFLCGAIRPSGRQSLQLCKEWDKRLPIRCISDPLTFFPVFGISLKASAGGGGRAGAARFFGGGGGGGGGDGWGWDSALRTGAVTSAGISQPYHSHPALHLFTSAAKGLAIQVRD